jgi:agmatine/peptidylarginine deiminase
LRFTEYKFVQHFSCLHERFLLKLSHPSANFQFKNNAVIMPSYEASDPAAFPASSYFRFGPNTEVGIIATKKP